MLRRLEAGTDREEEGLACTRRLLWQSGDDMSLDKAMHEMKRIIGLSLLATMLILVGLVSQVVAEGFPVKDLAHEGKSLSDFVPKGWTVEYKAEGDLNGDGVSDIAAILVQNDPEDMGDRALIVLVRSDGGKFTPAGINDKMLECKGCLGEGGSVNISIKKGVLIVFEWIGSQLYSKTTWRFRYESPRQRFILIGKDVESGYGEKGKVESFNYLTGQKVTTTFRYDANSDRKTVTSTKNEKGSRETPFIENVDLRD